MNVVLAWSPIGYETYLSLKQSCLTPTLLITARSFQPPESIAHLGTNHNYFGQTNLERQKSAESLLKFLETIRGFGKSFTLYVPQSGNFYNRFLIESTACDRFIFYDEGMAAHRPEAHARYSSEIYMRRDIIKNEALDMLCYLFGIDTNFIIKLYQNGVLFYDRYHLKFGGHVGFFPTAFPGHGLNLIDKVESQSTKGSAIILPALTGTVTDIISYSRKALKPFLVDYLLGLHKYGAAFKTHPGYHPDIRSHVQDFVLAVGNGVSIYEEFCEYHNISKFREPAFIEFSHYYVPNHSTALYLRLLGKYNITQI